MKRLMMTMICAVLLGTVAKADDDKPIAFEQLPKVAQEFINQHFTGVTISYAKVEADFMEKTYDVIFINGSKVEFNSKGEWKDVDCQKEMVPSGIMPSAITNYVSANHSGQKVTDISRDRYDYEVQLSNGIELVFDLKGNFLRFD